jgi:hypothetical protein
MSDQTGGTAAIGPDGGAVELTEDMRARRVAVARDVLDQIRAGRVNITVANYLAFKDYESGTRCFDLVQDAVAAGKSDLQNVVDEVAPLCMVCARGALLLSKARVFDAVPIAGITSPESGWFRIDRDVTDGLLADTFDPMTLSRIESAFEMQVMASRDLWDGLGSIRPEVKVELFEAVRFGLGFTDATMRCEAVMRNLVENRGEFLP